MILKGNPKIQVKGQGQCKRSKGQMTDLEGGIKFIEFVAVVPALHPSLHHETEFVEFDVLALC